MTTKTKPVRRRGQKPPLSASKTFHLTGYRNSTPFTIGIYAPTREAAEAEYAFRYGRLGYTIPKNYFL